MKNPNGNKGPNTSLIERMKQTINSQNEKGGTLGKANQQNNLGHKIHQKPPPPPPPFRPMTPGQEKDGPSIFDKWVEFRDKNLSSKIDNGFRKLTYGGKFVVRSVINSQIANDFKNKTKNELYGLKDKVKYGQENLKSSLSETLAKGKDVVSGKLGEGKEVLQSKLEVGKEKAEDVYTSGKNVLKDKVSQGKEYAQDAMYSSKEAAKERLIVGSEILKDRIGEGGQALKEKAGEFSGYAKEATKQVGSAAGSAYDSVKSAPDALTRQATKFTRRVAIYGIFGLAFVAFAFAVGSRLPQAYYEYQLKRQQLEASANTGEQQKKQ